MKNKKLKALIIVLAVLVLGLPVGRRVGEFFMGRNQLAFKFAEVTHGEIKKTISSSGPLSSITKVEVGSQISGTIAKVLVNYNDRVEKNQVLAEVDASLLKNEVGKAEGQLLRKQAELEDAQNDYHRNVPLFEKGAISDSQMEASRIKVKITEAEVKTGQAALDFARRTLDYATIRSPIAGTVITKEVEEGQTVAANFMTPRLFEIAEDLSRMEILVAVDESDIGLIQQGQRVRFQVQAYTDKEFSGSVKKVRLQPQKVANVVNYVVEVDAQNPDGLFLPGMTAEVDFIIIEKTNVMIIPKSALNFQPDKDTLKRFSGRLHPTATARLEAIAKNENGDDQTGYLWYLNDQKELAVQQVSLGVSDGSHTELLNPGSLRAGTKFISGIVEADDGSQSAKSSKKVFGMSGGGGGPPPPSGP